MKAKVIRAFYDLQDPARTIYQIGSEFEGDAKRVAELADGGFVEATTPAKPAPRKVKEQKEEKGE